MFDRFKYRFLDKRFIFTMDLCLSLIVSIAVAIIAFFCHVDAVESRPFNTVWGLSSLFASALMFYLFKTYTIIIRHFSFRDTSLFGFAMTGKVVIMGVVLAVTGTFGSSVLLMLVADALLSLVVLCMVRLLMIVVYESYKSRLREARKRLRVLIYGTSDKSAATVTRLRDSTHYDIVGFLTPDGSLLDTKFCDKPIYILGDELSFAKVSEELSLGGVIFATDADVHLEQGNLVGLCTKLGLKMLIVPTIDRLDAEGSEGRLSVREVKIEDLLGREEIKLSLDAIKAQFKDKVVMVTGAAGSIGSELCRQLAGFGVSRLVLYDNAETPMHNLRLELDRTFPGLDYVPVIGDVRLERRLDFAFRTYRPQVVFHAAAYKHVPLMEENPCEAVLVNVAGTRNVADKCVEYGVGKMVMISTDKAVNPTNIMGCTKRLAEIYVQSLGLAIEQGRTTGKTEFVTTRFGNVLGSNGSVIPRFREQIAAGGPVTVTDKNITRFFMTIPEACSLVMEAATLKTENRICVFDMGHPVKIDSLARRMIELSGLVPDKDIQIVYTGLRPGEKLYEEVLSNVENTEPTVHDKIRIAKVRQYDWQEALKVVDELEKLSRAVEIPDMVRLMKRTVPEYISNNSRFQEYDRK